MVAGTRVVTGTVVAGTVVTTDSRMPRAPQAEVHATRSAVAMQMVRVSSPHG